MFVIAFLAAWNRSALSVYSVELVGWVISQVLPLCLQLFNLNAVCDGATANSGCTAVSVLHQTLDDARSSMIARDLTTVLAFLLQDPTAKHPGVFLSLLHRDATSMGFPRFSSTILPFLRETQAMAAHNIHTNYGRALFQYYWEMLTHYLQRFV